MANLIKCPHCNKTFELTDAIRHQIEEELESTISEKHKLDIANARKEIEQKLVKELEDKKKIELLDLEKQNSEKEKKIADLMDSELKLREEKRKMEDKDRERELEMQRKLDEEKKKIEETVLKQAVEEHRFKDLEKDKKISDLQKQLEDALIKTKVGSQQLQGEVLELDIETLLKENFSTDDIAPVEKGVKGADIRQVVKSPKGYVSGTILWEIKRTKAWTDSWIAKLKDDLRAEKANVPVIISTTLPKEVESGFGLYEGVWVVSFNLVLPVAAMIRKSLLDVAYEKAVSSHKGGKSEILYDYITSHEFRQQLEAIVEVYREMQDSITKERGAYERMWKAREGQLQRLMSSTANIVGSIQGRVGQTALPIKGLDLLDDGQE